MSRDVKAGSIDEGGFCMDARSMHYDIYCGVDVGKSSHYLIALSEKDDEHLKSVSVPQDEFKIRDVLGGLSAQGVCL
jgi:hypothetical protein